MILGMSFFEAVVDTLCTRRVDILYLKSNENDIPAACFATRPEPPGRRGYGRLTGGRMGRSEEARQGGGIETGKYGGSEAERTTE